MRWRICILDRRKSPIHPCHLGCPGLEFRRIHRASPLFNVQQSRKEDSIISRALPIQIRAGECRKELMLVLAKLLRSSTLEPVIISNVVFEGATLRKNRVGPGVS
jgi:hypothetical protein